MAYGDIKLDTGDSTVTLTSNSTWNNTWDVTTSGTYTIPTIIQPSVIGGSSIMGDSGSMPHHDVEICDKSKFIPFERLSKDALENHFSLVGENMWSIRSDKMAGRVMDYLDTEVEDYYSYCVDESFFGKTRIDIYFESKDDLKMLLQHVVQWKLEMTEEDEEEEDDTPTVGTGQPVSVPYNVPVPNVPTTPATSPYSPYKKVIDNIYDDNSDPWADRLKYFKDSMKSHTLGLRNLTRYYSQGKKE